ncbi:MAG: hypothetical protein Q8M64_10775 [Methyloversatilis sp.]|nr:hypothetical protein [Methyloversatilis sp.]
MNSLLMTTSTTSCIRGRVVFLATSVCSALTTFVAVVFFVVGIGDGSVSSFNLVLWLGLLSVMALSLWAGYALHARGRVVLAIAALAVTALPGILATLFVLLAIVTQPRWN